MKKLSTLALALLLCLSVNTSFSQGCTPLVFIAQANIQSGFYTPAMGGQNSIAGATIFIRYRLIVPFESMSAWIIAGSATLPNACTGFIAGSQVDTSTMSDLELHQFQGFLIQSPDTFWTQVQNYSKKRAKKHFTNVAGLSFAEAGFNPTLILIPDAFKNTDGIIDLSTFKFVSTNDETEAESLLDFVKVTNLSNGFSVLNPLNLPLKVSVYNINGTLVDEANNGNLFEVGQLDYLLTNKNSQGIYLVRVDYANSSKTEKLFIP